MKGLIKICGITNQEDAHAAVSAGADYLGFVFEPDSRRCVGELDWSPGWLDEIEIPKIAVFGPHWGDPEYRFDRMQMVDRQFGREYEPQSIWQVIRLGENRVLQPGLETELILLDTFVQGSYGGTGVELDLQKAAFFRSAMPAMVGIAGGLTPENVARAIEVVRPDLVDVSSGVELFPGKKDPDLMKRFVANAREAFEKQ